MLIAFIHDDASAHLTQALSLLGEVKRFSNQSQLRDYLLSDAPCDLVVSATDGALGMNCCSTAHDRRRGVPILWITEQTEFEPESRRIPVDAFLVKPVAPSQVFSTAERLLHRPPEETPPADIAPAVKPSPVKQRAAPAPPPPKKKFSQWLRARLGSGTQPIEIDTKNREEKR